MPTVLAPGALFLLHWQSSQVEQAAAERLCVLELLVLFEATKGPTSKGAIQSGRKRKDETTLRCRLPISSVRPGDSGFRLKW
jgi:hypothetical protein